MNFDSGNEDVFLLNAGIVDFMKLVHVEINHSSNFKDQSKTNSHPTSTLCHTANILNC
jgi:hypothetical protein